MERSVWTDERLSDRFDAIDRRLDRIDGELVALRTEMREGFAEMRSLMFRLHLGTLIPMLGLIAAVIARGG